MSESTAVVPAVQQVCTTFEKMAPKFQSALPPQIPVERFVRVVQTAVQKNPDLIREGVDRNSLYSSALICAQDGLLPDGREAALVIYRKNVAPSGQTKRFVEMVQYMPMVAGILKKVRNSGELLTIGAHVVYEREIEQGRFRYVLGDDERIEHEPIISGDRGKPALTYAIAKTRDGGIYREIMTEEQVDAVRSISRAKDTGPWAGPFADEMRRKTVIRRLAKRLPMSTDLEQVIERDNELYDVERTPSPPEPRDVTEPQTPKPEQPAGKRRPRALAAVTEAAAPPPPERQREPGDDDEPIEGEVTRQPEDII